MLKLINRFSGTDRTEAVAWCDSGDEFKGWTLGGANLASECKDDESYTVPAQACGICGKDHPDDDCFGYPEENTTACKPAKPDEAAFREKVRKLVSEMVSSHYTGSHWRALASDILAMLPPASAKI